MSIAERFSANLSRCRERAGLSQSRLAKLSSLHLSQVCRLEEGAHLPRIDTVVKLAGALRIDSSDLLAGMRWEAGPARPGRFISNWAAERELACGDG
jgi:transcriptional regulator with XRE-family HTH domain